MENIGEEVVRHFETFFKEDGSPHLQYLNCTNQVITLEENDSLTVILTDEEIKQALFGLNPNSAPSPDGFNGHFYQNCWAIKKRPHGADPYVLLRISTYKILF